MSIFERAWRIKSINLFPITRLFLHSGSWWTAGAVKDKQQRYTQCYTHSNTHASSQNRVTKQTHWEHAHSIWQESNLATILIKALHCHHKSSDKKGSVFHFQLQVLTCCLLCGLHFKAPICSIQIAAAIRQMDKLHSTIRSILTKSTKNTHRHA